MGNDFISEVVRLRREEKGDIIMWENSLSEIVR